MLIAVLSDIHGNFDALKNVLSEIKKLQVEAVLVLGDIIGYYYDTEEVLDAVGQLKNLYIIKGNHEEMFLNILDGKINPGSIREKYGSSLDMAATMLTPGKIEFLRKLKSTENIVMDGIRIKIAHGSPWNLEQYIYPDAGKELLNQCDSTDSDFVFLGHTHYPFVYSGTNSVIVNPGSVGQSRTNGGMASWGVLNTKNSVYTQRQTMYDTSRLKGMVQRIDPQVPFLYEVLNRKL